MWHTVIGIDLGTTYSAVASYHAGQEQAMLIEDHNEGNALTTPSVVGWDSGAGRVIVGRTARRTVRALQKPIIEIKREMGEVFDEKLLDRFNARGVYNVGDPVRVFFAGEWLLPQEISAFTLTRMRQIAEQELRTEIRDAVVTVPAYFTDKQKSATYEAALLAGLYPRQLIAEPTAAAICYGVDTWNPDRRVYLVYDLGGGTFDVSIIEVEGERIDVIATSGDRRLGGSDFDNAITEWAMNELKRDGLDVLQVPAGRELLKQAAEEAKILLSSYQETKLNLAEVYPNRPPQLILTREKFLELINADLRKSLSFVDDALERAQHNRNIAREDVSAVLLVGGSTRIPKVREMLAEHFLKDASFVRADADPDAVVARGAAVVAHRFEPTPPPFDITRPTDDASNIRLADDGLVIGLITEHSLGVGTANHDLVDKIVTQGTSIPVTVTKSGYTNSGQGSYTMVPVCQGEGDYLPQNTKIGELKIGPHAASPPGTHQFEVTFALDVNGLLTVSVRHINENKTYTDQYVRKTSVGGLAALVPLYNRILRYYFGAGGATDLNLPPPQLDDHRAPTDDSTTPRETPPYPGTEGKSLPRPGAAASPTLVEVSGNVPEAFKSLVRRSQKLLLSKLDVQLAERFNRFVSALNASASNEKLEELADELEDAYHDARTQS